MAARVKEMVRFRPRLQGSHGGKSEDLVALPGSPSRDSTFVLVQREVIADNARCSVPLLRMRGFAPITAVRTKSHKRSMPLRPEVLNQHQANERTLLAWLRTGISMMGFGFAIAKFGLYMRELIAAGHLQLPQAAAHHVGSGWIGTAFVAVGIFTNFFGTLHFRRMRSAIERGDADTPSSFLAYAIGAMTTLIGSIMMVLLFAALQD
jgi:putative membrane protein